MLVENTENTQRSPILYSANCNTLVVLPSMLVSSPISLNPTASNLQNSWFSCSIDNQRRQRRPDQQCLRRTKAPSQIMTVVIDRRICRSCDIVWIAIGLWCSREYVGHETYIHRCCDLLARCISAHDACRNIPGVRKRHVL